MARSRYEEAIRLYVETAGDEELKALVAQFGELGDVAGAESEAARKALDGINDAAARLAKVEAFAKLKRDLAETEAELGKAQRGVQELFREFKAGDTSNTGIVKLQRDAAAAAGKLRAEAEAQRLEVHRAREELRGMGVDSRSLSAAQVALRGQFASQRAELTNLVGALAKAKAETAALAARRSDFTRFLGDGRDAAQDAAQALDTYRKRAADAAAENERLKRSGSGIGSVFGGIRKALAGVAAYIGLREAGQGVISLLKVAAASEDANRALRNLYGGQAEGNKAFEQLRVLAKQNGLAFQDVVDQAKKLKSFGLDPLNGSLQALVDQNAAVGGSQEDLSGKVLALGQAWAKQKLQGEEILQLVERGVPVWSLLEKATGKNVQELQKLSEQGKLGRGVIKALYEEIGKANAGAAQQGLSSLSGLLQQVSARWNDFLNRVADNGVTDYFKREIGSLLGSTQNLDGLAKRVADAIIGTLEALKRFALQIAPVASALGSFTLGLFKHAEALLFVAKVYAGLKIAQVAQQFGAAAVASQTAAAATTALGNASAGAVGQVGLLGRAMALLPRLLRISIATVGIEASISLLTSLNGLMQERQKQLIQDERASIIQKQIQQELVTSGQELTRVYAQYATVAVQGGQQVSQMTRAQAEDYQFALTQAQNYYRGLAIEAKAAGNAQAEAAALDKFDALGKSIQTVTTRLSELSATAAKETTLDAFVTKTVANFDKLASKGDALGKVVSGIFDGLNLASPRGIEQAISILDQVTIRGTEAGAAITKELRTAIAGVADEDLPRLQKSAEEAMKAGSVGAKLFADELNSINLTRLGVDIEAIKTGFTRTGRVVVDQFKASIREVDKLGLTAVQKSQAIATAFDNAFAKASTSVELEALKRALQDAISSGSLGFVEYQQRVDGVNAKLDELANKGKKAPEALNEGLDKTVPKLRDVQREADKAAESVDQIGQAGSGAASGLNSANTAAQSLIFSISGVSDEFVELLKTENDFQLGKKFFQQLKDLQAAVIEVKNLNAEFDGIASKRSDLQKKFNLVNPTEVEELVQLEKQLEENRKRRAEEEKRISDEAKRTAQEALDEARKLDIERAQAGLETISTFRLEVVAAEGVGAKLVNGGRVDAATARMLADAIASPLLARIERARGISNQPRRRTR